MKRPSGSMPVVLVKATGLKDRLIHEARYEDAAIVRDAICWIRYRSGLAPKKQKAGRK